MLSYLLVAKDLASTRPYENLGNSSLIRSKLQLAE
jgi:hypothetical protein